MTGFIQHSLSFPTFIFSLLLVVVLIFWIITAVGLTDIDSLDIDLPDADMGGDDLPLTGVSGLLVKFRMNGVPLTILLTILTLCCWMLSYFCQYLLLSKLAASTLSYLYYPAGIIAFIAVFYLGLLLTAILIQPIRSWLRKMDSHKTTSSRSLLGREVIVRTPEVTLKYGEGTIENGGAGLILQIRAPEEAGFRRGDIVIIYQYNETGNAYMVVSENEFKGVRL